MGKNAIEVRDVSIKFNLSRERVDTFKEYFIKLLHGELQYDEFWALKLYSGKRGQAWNFRT